MLIPLMKKNIGVTIDQAAIMVALKYCDDYEKLKNFYKKKRFSVKTLFVIAILSGCIGAGVSILLQYFM